VTAALLFLLATTIVNLTLDAEFPVVGPAFYFAAMYCCAIAGLWSLGDFRIGKVIAWWLVVASLVFCLVVRFHPDGLDKLPRMWSDVTALDLLVMAAYAAVAYVFAVREVARDRSGCFRDWPDLQQLYNRATSPLFRREGSFSSPSAAQFWCEWRPRGLVVPGGFACLVLLIVGVWIVCSFRKTIHFDPVDSPVGLLLVLPSLAALAIGIHFGHRRRGRKPELEGFVATRPLPDSAITSAILKAAATSTLLVWAIGVLGGAAAIGWFVLAKGRLMTCLAPAGAGALEVVFGVFLCCVGSLLAAWTVMSLVATVFLTGRNWLVITFFTTLMCWPYLPLLCVLLGSIGLFKVLALSSLVVAGLGSLGGAVWAFAAARQKRFISLWTLSLAGAAWMALCAIFLIAVPEARAGRDMPSMLACAAVLGLLTLPVAPLAAAPLALAWNRHR
jgi:hypothetical protein